MFMGEKCPKIRLLRISLLLSYRVDFIASSLNCRIRRVDNKTHTASVPFVLVRNISSIIMSGCS